MSEEKVFQIQEKGENLTKAGKTHKHATSEGHPGHFLFNLPPFHLNKVDSENRVGIVHTL